MTKDEIIRMAWEAGLQNGPVFVQGLERFAGLVAAAERERLVAKFMEIHNAQQHRNNYFAFAAKVIREET
jgi:hypothetical protein